MPDCNTGLMHRYSAFISYSHMDAAFARKLHRRLEGYRLPRRLVSARVGESRRLQPIFRDHEELAAAPDLSSAVKAAMAESQYLVVICSSHAEASDWVKREVSLFRDLHGQNAVLAVLVDGCPQASFRNLLCGGDFGGLGAEPLAADFRRDGDGRALAFLKLVAVLADVRLDALVQRDAQRRIRQIMLASASAFVGVVALASLAVMTVQARAAAEREHERSETFVRHQREEVRNKLTAHGRIDIIQSLDNGAADYYKSQDVARLSAVDQEEYAKVLQDIGQDDESSGDLDDAALQFAEAYRLTSALLKKNPDDTKRIFSHAQSEFYVGESARRTGHNDAAERSFRAYAALANRLVTLEPGNPDWLMERGDSQSDLGTFFLREKSDLGRAESYYKAALSAYQAVYALHPDDTTIAREIAEVYGWLGDVARLKGDCRAATAYREHTTRMLTDLERRDPGNADLKSALAANELALARIDLCGGATDAALEKLKNGHDAAATLAEDDPHNADRRRQVRIFELFEVATWLSEPFAARPVGDVIVQTLGDCANEAKLRNNDEIAQFCFILQARRSMRLGRTEDAQAALKSARTIGDFHTDALSPRWGLNFSQEMKSAAKIQPDVEMPR